MTQSVDTLFFILKSLVGLTFDTLPLEWFAKVSTPGDGILDLEPVWLSIVF